MSVLFKAHPTNNRIGMGAGNADRYAGNLIKWEEFEDSTRSGGVYLKPNGNTWSRDLAGELVFRFEITVENEYEIAILCDTNNREAFVWAELNGNKQLLGSNNSGLLKLQSNGFAWQRLPDATFTLPVGIYTLKLRSISADLKIDKISATYVTDVNPPQGNTNVGLSAEFPEGGPPIVIDETYDDWKRNPENDKYRITLVELDNDVDTLRVATRSWVSDENLSYYNEIKSKPYLQEDINEMVSVGDLTLLNKRKKEWRNLLFAGHRSRWYHGDIRWPKSEFKVLLTATTEACRPLGNNEFQFDILSDSQKYNKTFWNGENAIQEFTARDAFSWLINQVENPGSLQYINMSQEQLDKQLIFEVTESSNLYDLVTTCCHSIECYPRFTQTGYLEIIFPDYTREPAQTFNEDNVIKNSLGTVETVEATSEVVVNYNVDQSLSRLTEAETGNIDNVNTLETFLKLESDAAELAEKRASLFSNKRERVRLKIYNAADYLTIGDVSNIILPRDNISSLGLVEVTKIRPANKVTEVEFLI